MFVDLTEPERQRFIKQKICYIPGYTGHCPTIQFRYGKTYGANTKSIIEELRDISPICKDPGYRRDDPHKSMLHDTIKRMDIENGHGSQIPLARRPYVLGYTGYIPGLNYLYGSSFSQLADQSRLEFTKRLSDVEQRRSKERLEFVTTKPQLTSIRGRDDVTEVLNHYSRFNNKTDKGISEELPPIAGYTGHIPGMKGNENSLSQRFHSAAQSGLSLLQQEKNRRRHLDVAKEAIKDAITYSHVH